MPAEASPSLPLRIRPDQFATFEAQRLRSFAVEVSRHLSNVSAQRGVPSPVPAPTMTDFALEQLQKAEASGLTRKDEMMAFALCALVYGDGFEHEMPQPRQILAEKHYNRATLFAQLAIQRLNKEAAGL